jgi:hypothetical protein
VQPSDAWSGSQPVGLLVAALVAEKNSADHTARFGDSSNSRVCAHRCDDRIHGQALV